MAKKESKSSLPAAQEQALLQILQKRFEQNMHRHAGLKWADVLQRLQGAAAKLWSLNEMEETGGEPDVIGQDAATGAYIFCDCAAESPKGRRSLCYDHEAWEARKEARPAGNVVDTAAAMGIELLNEAAYRALQQFGPFDTKTSSWISTPDVIRDLGGALFCDYRYGTVFTYHNGASSYYAARAFRGKLLV
ncbi:DUF4256 domain-containing protein [Paracnuella aquatica]|uniref:DUF4256 domain-containing protein n=1 Tax=Paracnuella aquatica TaxID=2268757 RepID=UPI000DEF98EE|nr:DUF4256 domain-containing protein [Paracnuella aquatica]RPD44411.1 DUF4256 domain-containing protein [Paracnuella aquatica]